MLFLNFKIKKLIIASNKDLDPGGQMRGLKTDVSLFLIVKCGLSGI